VLSRLIASNDLEPYAYQRRLLCVQRAMRRGEDFEVLLPWKLSFTKINIDVESPAKVFDGAMFL